MTRKKLASSVSERIVLGATATAKKENSARCSKLSENASTTESSIPEMPEIPSKLTAEKSPHHPYVHKVENARLPIG